ncbi:protein AMBP-like [Alosa pseudoharengus]|uniref:protein AMBP-like n=1 Tax=Alosa pseudoharengus TaxID=34774 RepID=UPI003F8CC87C
MQAAALVMFLGVLVGPLHATPLPSEPQLPTQENFNLDRFMGKWYGLAKASTCPHWLKHKGDSAVGTLLLDKQTSANTISVTKTKSRQGVCKQSSDEYKVTETPGRFQYYFSKWDADVDMYVVDTDYDAYALVVKHKHKRNSDKRGSNVSLYGRTPVLPEALMETFRRVVTEQGMTEDNIGIKKNKGECSPGDVNPDTPVE